MYSSGDQVKTIKHRLDVIDEASRTYKYTVLEGELLSDAIDKISKEIKVVEGPSGGSILKSTSVYHTKGDHQIDEEKLKSGEQKGLALLKAAEAYLLANPNEFN